MFAIPAASVKRSDFRTCAESGFCSRQRSYPDSLGSGWIASGLKLDNGITWKMAKDDILLESKLVAYTGGILRLQVDEPSRKPKRFRIAENEVVLDEQLIQAPFTKIDENTFKIENIQVEINSSPFSITVYRDNQQIIEFNGSKMFNFESSNGPNPETFKQWTDEQPYGKQSLAADILFSGKTHLIGIPEHATSLILKSTRSIASDGTVEYQEPYRLYNLDVFEYELDSPMALYGAIPFMMGLQAGKDLATGIFWNNPSETWIDVYTPNSSPSGRLAHFMSEAGVLDLFIFPGPNPAAVLSQYYKVTGAPHLPPIFSLGYHQCRWNYMDEDDLLEINEKLEENEIPADVLWLDIEHTDGKRYFTWNKQTFPDPKEMQGRLVGRKLVTIVDPHIKKDEGYHIYKDLIKKKLAVSDKDGNVFEGDCWPGRSIWPDFLNPSTRVWWRSLFNQKSYPV